MADRGRRGGSRGGGSRSSDSNWRDRSGASGGGGFGSGGGGNVMKFNVPGKDAGRIIGKGGSRKRELEEESGATIKVFSRGEDGTTPVEISGSKECQEKAKALIDDILDSFDRNMSFQSEGGGGGGGRRGDNRYNDDDSRWRGGGGGGGDVLSFTVDSRDVGRIIGRGGSRIREIEDDSGTSIKVQSRRGDGMNVPVEISGDPEARERAKQMIDDILDSQSQKPQGGYRGRSNYDNDY